MKPFILALTGPAGTGKSTTAEHLSQEVDRCVNLEVDHVKHFIVNGFDYEDSPEGRRQWELLGTNLGQLALNYQDAGYNVILNGYLRVSSWRNVLSHVSLDHRVLLLPHLNTVNLRDAERHQDKRVGPETTRQHYDYFSTDPFYDGFTVIDSTTHSPNQTVAEIRKVIGHKPTV